MAKCIDDDISQYGHYDSIKTANLMLVFEKCDSDKRACKSENQIDDWLEFKYIMVIENTKSLIPHLFDEDSILQVSTLKFYPISQYRTDIVQVITRSLIVLND